MKNPYTHNSSIHGVCEGEPAFGVDCHACTWNEAVKCTLASLNLSVADLTVDRVEHVVKRGGREIELTVHEYKVLEYLMLNKGNFVSKEDILKHAWKTTDISNVVDVYMTYLRTKIDVPFGAKLIESVRGKGIRIRG